jgi:hypothetical protein
MTASVSVGWVQVTVQRASGTGDYIIPAASATVSVTIEANDAVAGVFSLQRIGDPSPVEERLPEATVPFLLVREVSQVGEVSVFWSVAPDCASDVAPSGGVERFAVGQANASLFVTVRDDAIPELEESCRLAIDQIVVHTEVADDGRIDPSANAFTFVLAASDFPFGVFSVDNSSRFVQGA